MKNIKKRVCASITTLLAISILSVNVAAEEDVTLTVVVPSRTGTPASPVYPIDVTLTDNGKDRYIVKTYDTSKPEQIPIASFEQDGYQYTLTDIIKNSTANNITKEHTEVVTIETKTKEMEEILAELPLTIKYTSSGYAGELSLDIKSLLIESIGTGWSSYPITAKREYPHLSSNDVSLVPKTITEKGVELVLEDIDWRAASTTNIDFDDIEDTYTAHATYSGTGSYSYDKGYFITAEYKGDVHKAAIGKTTYSAHFTGTKIQLALPFVEDDPVDSTVNLIETEGTDVAEPETTESTELAQDKAKPSFSLPLLVALLISLPISVIAIWLYLRSEKKATALKKKLDEIRYDDEYRSDDDYIQPDYISDDIYDDIYDEADEIANEPEVLDETRYMGSYVLPKRHVMQEEKTTSEVSVDENNKNEYE